MKILLAMIMFILSGCASLNYDAGQYDRIVSILNLSESSIKLCNRADKIRPRINEISELASHQVQYSKYRATREKEYLASVELAAMASELKIKYDSANPSVNYCSIKLQHIREGAILMLKTLGAM
jgi:hypothetical protein